MLKLLKSIYEQCGAIIPKLVIFDAIDILGVEVSFFIITNCPYTEFV